MSTFERELLAAVESLDNWFYTWVHMRPTTVYTDHQLITFSTNYKRGIRGKQLGLLEKLLEFSNVTFIHHPERCNIFADVLSRIATLGQKKMKICSFFYSSNYKELVISKQTPQDLVKSRRKEPDICKTYGRLKNAFDWKGFLMLLRQTSCCLKVWFLEGMSMNLEKSK